MARDIQVKYAIVWRWESNRCDPNLENMMKLSEYLKVPVEQLVQRKDGVVNGITRIGIKERVPRTIHNQDVVSEETPREEGVVTVGSGGESEHIPVGASEDGGEQDTQRRDSPASIEGGREYVPPQPHPWRQRPKYREDTDI
jgi:transcriptional regulator with XRE-family HTH domain